MKSLGARAQGLRLERMRASPQWQGGDEHGRAAGFRNTGPVRPGLRDPHAQRPSWAEFLGGGARRRPSAPLPTQDPREAWRRAPGSALRATWLGHSTVLVEMDGVRILTDPVWGARASPTRIAGPKRFAAMPVALQQLPPLTAVVLSHDHYDHLCMATVRELARMRVPFITSLGVGAHLEAFGVDPALITELDWWQSHGLPGTEVQVTATPAQHFSGRSLSDRNATLWSSFVLQGPRHKVFFSGDTGLTDAYSAIRERFAARTPFDLVMLEVGAYHPSWGDIHLGPHNALEALALLGGGPFLPVHWATFSLSLHAWDEPAETLLTHAPGRGVHLLMPRPGEVLVPARVDSVLPWWRGVETQEAAPQQPLRWPKALPYPVE